MTIEIASAPAGVRDTLVAALRQRIHQRGLTRSLRGAPRLGPAIPAYLLERSALDHPRPLAQARLRGWRFPVVDGEAEGLASVDLREEGPAGYAGLAEGLLPRRVLQGARLAETRFAQDQERHAFRLLDCPALEFHAIWLHGSRRNHFIVLIDGWSAAGESLVVEDGIVPRLRDADRRVAARTAAIAALLTANRSPAR